jgi:hypothetical protein
MREPSGKQHISLTVVLRHSVEQVTKHKDKHKPTDTVRLQIDRMSPTLTFTSVSCATDGRTWKKLEFELRFFGKSNTYTQLGREAEDKAADI